MADIKKTRAQLLQAHAADQLLDFWVGSSSQNGYATSEFTRHDLVVLTWHAAIPKIENVTIFGVSPFQPSNQSGYNFVMRATRQDMIVLYDDNQRNDVKFHDIEPKIRATLQLRKVAGDRIDAYVKHARGQYNAFERALLNKPKAEIASPSGLTDTENERRRKVLEQLLDERRAAEKAKAEITTPQAQTTLPASETAPSQPATPIAPPQKPEEVPVDDLFTVIAENDSRGAMNLLDGYNVAKLTYAMKIVDDIMADRSKAKAFGHEILRLARGKIFRVLKKKEFEQRQSQGAQSTRTDPRGPYRGGRNQPVRRHRPRNNDGGTTNE